MVTKKMEKRSETYRNPEVECPKCRKAITGTKQMKVGIRTAVRSGTWKVLDRWYHCSGCGFGFYHEVEAKPVEGRL